MAHDHHGRQRPTLKVFDRLSGFPPQNLGDAERRKALATAALCKRTERTRLHLMRVHNDNSRRVEEIMAPRIRQFSRNRVAPAWRMES
jgi:hypothetical protein